MPQRDRGLSKIYWDFPSKRKFDAVAFRKPCSSASEDTPEKPTSALDLYSTTQDMCRL